MAVNSRVGSLTPGQQFVTVHTRRGGRVLGPANDVSRLYHVDDEVAERLEALPDDGVVVILDGELRDLHPSVLVEAA